MRRGNVHTTAKLLPRGKQGDEVWLANTSAAEAANWAGRKFTERLPFLVSVCETRDAARLDGVIKELRHVVTRLEAYQRQCVREWNATKGAESESENRTDS